jgi:DivIVA domain-containing protein
VLSGILGWLFPLTWVLLGLGVVAVVALVTIGRLDIPADPQPDLAPLDLAPDGVLAPKDVDNVTFAVGLRGYRMDQVDVVLDRLGEEIAGRDAEIAELRHQLATAESVDPVDDYTGEHPIVAFPAARPVATAAPVPSVDAEQPATPYGTAPEQFDDRPPV